MPTSPGKLKILCLHGYRQNGQAFREKTGSFRKIVKKLADFYFCDAPHQVGEEQRGGDNQPCLGWYFSRDDNYFRAVESSDTVKGFQESVDKIKDVFQNQGPFDGLLGFSQGACFISLLCALKDRGDIDLDFKFVMLFAGFESRCSPHALIYQGRKLETPSLVCVGEGDEVIPIDMGLSFINLFKDPVVVKHSGGHYIPSNGELRKAYCEFLESKLDTTPQSDNDQVLSTEQET